MIWIAKRNLKLFFRDKSAVFFSLLGVFVIIGLYVLFLGDTYARSIKGIDDARFLMDSWIMAGLLAVTSMTTSMGAFGIMVDDKSKKVLKDFYSSPIKRASLVGGYIFSAFLIGVIISIITLFLLEIYVVANGGVLLSLGAFAKTLGLIILSVMSSSAMIFFMVSFFKSQNAFSTASTLIGTLIGFLTGIYLPIGSLPQAVQLVIKVFPVSHAAVLFRQVIMETVSKEVFVNAPSQMVESFNQNMGVIYKFGDYQVTTIDSIIVLLITTVLFYGLSILNISRKSRS